MMKGSDCLFDAGGNSFNAAIYVRLSREDGDKEESNSISNQKQLIREFLKSEPNTNICAEMVDDGYSGSNFERPAFQEMMEMIRAGKINCIAVKDLSRFGRNYIEAGRYIQQIFPFLGVRFIAINDNYDSLKRLSQTDSIIIPFKNLINDAYCRDISTKIKSQLDVKRKRGEFIGAFAAYGYLKHPEDKNKLIIDDYAAKVVRDIFCWKISGMSQKGIADKLNQSGIYSPAEYKKSIGLAYRTGFKEKDECRWTAVSVGRILLNKLYIGTIEQGKKISPSFRVNKRIDVPKEDWTRVEHSHEAIISEDDFTLVQDIMLADTRTAPANEEVYPFSGMIFCGDCLSAMVRKTIPAGKKKYIYYVCSQNKDEKKCSPHSINLGNLERAILSTVNKHIESIVLSENISKTIDGIPKANGSYHLESQLLAAQKQLEKYEDLLSCIYEDLKDGILDEADYKQLRNAYTTRCQKLKDTIFEIQNKFEVLHEYSSSRNSICDSLKDGGKITSLNRLMSVELIDKIIVYEGSRIDIKFKYKNFYENIKAL